MRLNSVILASQKSKYLSVISLDIEFWYIKASKAQKLQKKVKFAYIYCPKYTWTLPLLP